MAQARQRPIPAAAAATAAGVLAALFQHAVGFPSYGLRVPNGRRVPCPEGVGGCSDGEAFLCQPVSVCNGLGHNSCAGGTLPLNPFGQALADHDFAWTRELCEADSDGDGLTNGEELGDPCCLWEEGDEPSDYAKAFVATHPGFVNSAEVVASYEHPASCEQTAPSAKAPPMNAFNKGEVQKSVDVRIEAYPVPAQATTYVDIALNWPDDSADLFHIVSAHVLLDKKNLHHFVLRGCSELFPEELVGKPIQRSDTMLDSCEVSLGGWTPGSRIVETLPHVGVPIGRAAGVRALWLNVHYDNPELESGIVDSSGIRFYYTTTLRPHSARGFSMAQVSGNPLMHIPAGVARWFLTRTCHLEVTSKATKEPAEFHVYGVSYHAHLLGREMYAELKRAGEEEFQDLASAVSWHFDDQGSQNIAAWNISLRTGDALQTTCVMDSRSRSAVTIFGRETTDEMCWASIRGWPADVDLQCTGEFWDGYLAHGEPGLGLTQRHPLVNASSVWDGTNPGSGGKVVRLDVSSRECIDAQMLANRCPMLLARATSCDSLLPIASEQGLSFAVLDVCCKSACEALCPENPRCNQTGQEAAAPPPFDREGVDLQEPRCWTPGLGVWSGFGSVEETPLAADVTTASPAWFVLPPFTRQLLLVLLLLLLPTLVLSLTAIASVVSVSASA